jgi:hypothetical protein
MNREEKLAALGVALVFGTTMLIVLAPLLALLAACGVAGYGFYRAMKWALREDRVEKAERAYTRSVWQAAEEMLRGLGGHES